MTDHDSPKADGGFFYKPATIRWSLRLIYVICAGLIVAEFFIHRHGHFSAEALPGFFAIAGFFAYMLVVAGSVVLGKFVHRSEDYYAAHGEALDCSDTDENKAGKQS